MAEKTRILDSLDEKALLLPTLVNRALAANDRIKYRLSLLQAAQSHAENPDAPASNLHAERLAAGVQWSEFDRIVVESIRVGKGRYRVPESARIVREAIADAGEMLVPLAAAGTAEGAELAQRFESFAAADGDDGDLTAEVIHALTSGSRDSGDSLHLLVMDMHRGVP